MPTELSDALRTVEQLLEQLATEQPIAALTAIGRLERVTVDELDSSIPHTPPNLIRDSGFRRRRQCAARPSAA